MAEPQRALLVAGKGPDWWSKEIGRSWSALKDYRDKAEKTIKRYRAEKDEARTAGKRFNILFSNTETLKPAIYSQMPIPDIRRRFLDKDPVGRLSATILQRSVSYCLESYDFDSVLEACALDYLLPGICVARVKYKPYFKKTAKTKDGQPVVGEDKQPAFDEELIYQEAATEYIPYDRFLTSRSKVYERVWWVGYADDLTKDEVTAQFGEKVAEALPYSKKENTDDEKEQADPTIRIWEVWCKRDRKRAWVAEGYTDWVKAPEADPLKLERFYPNPKPVWSIPTNDTLEPIPEYVEYKDQALELDDLTERIDVLTSALRRRGIYDAAVSNLAQMMKGSTDNNFVPVDNWAAMMEKGGIERFAMEMPLDGLIKAVVALEDRRERVKQTIYEVTGIADIVRGSSNPNETLGAQQLKGKWAGLRISTRQKKFANFARDLVRLKAEIIAERFDPQTLSLMSGIKLPTAAEKQQYQQAQQMAQMRAQMPQGMPMQGGMGGQQMPMQPPPPPDPAEAEFFNQPTWEDVMGVLRNDKLRGFKIDIETDSTVQPDADAEKQARSELLQALGGFAQAMVPAIQAGVVPKKLAVEAIQFTLRAFKVGSAFEQELDQMTETNPGPTPEQQAKEQELQQREQALMQEMQRQKDEGHQLALAQKDAKAAGDAVSHKQEIFDLKQQMAEEVKRLEEGFEKAIRDLASQAENTVRDIARDQTPQGAVQ